MIVITGASGKTGSVAAHELLNKGHKVRVIGRSLDHLASFAAKGAEVAVGDQGDPGFLTEAFKGADSVYLLIPPKLDADDIRSYYNQMGDIAVGAITTAGVGKVVFLSSLGAEQEKGTGPVLGLHDVEKKLGKVSDLDLTILRPGYFMENTLGNLSLIKHKGINGGPASPDAPILMVASHDIGVKAAELLRGPASRGMKIIDLFGERISYKEVTALFGRHIGKPDLQYVRFPDADAIGALMGMGFSRSVAASFVELAQGLNEGRVTTTRLDPHKPNAPTSFAAFAADVLAPAFSTAA